MEVFVVPNLRESKGNLRVYKKCNSTVLFDSGIRSDCKIWENSQFHVSFRIDDSGDTESSLFEDNLPSIPFHNER